jgi:hypothetical protein
LAFDGFGKVYFSFKAPSQLETILAKVFSCALLYAFSWPSRRKKNLVPETFR